MKQPGKGQAGSKQVAHPVPSVLWGGKSCSPSGWGVMRCRVLPHVGGGN